MDDKEVHLEACQLRELFKGRFSQDEMEKVVSEMGGKLQALDFILRVDPGQVSGFMKKSTPYIENLQRDSIHLNEVLESGVFDVETSKRQFGCKKCQRSWWRKVPLRKEVSTCHVCKTRYDAIPRDKEWGWGMFYCDGENCGEEFQGFAVMGMTKSMCHRCGYYVLVDHIIPPNKFSRNKKKRTRDTHDCNGINCYRRPPARAPNRNQDGSLIMDRAAICIHPKSKPFRPPDAQYRTWSQAHRSTGSTVDTHIDQRSVFSGSGSFAYTLPSRR